MTFKLPELKYSYDALEPYIDKETVEIHHWKHHQTYVDKLNAAAEWTDAINKDFEEIFENISEYSSAIRNNWWWVYNHNFYWESISPNAWWKPSWELLEDIENTFGNFDTFKEQMEEAWITQFGSGWAWLILDENWKLKITKTPNQDNPIMDIVEEKWTPLLTIDVWEHAYYLKYQNKRPEYLKNFWNLVDWEKVEERYKKAK